MTEAITLITPTGDRPLAFALCQNWMKKQTLQSFQWIVVDDGKTPMTPCVPMKYIRREPRPDDPQCTLTRNFEAALPLIKGNKIIIIEDDEYYAPKYLAEMSLRLSQYEIVGLGNTKYYYLFSGGYYRHGNKRRASLAQTAFQGSFLPEFKEILNMNVGSARIDRRIWENVRENNRGLIFFDDNDSLYLGIKGLPGRPGMIGHDPKARPYRWNPPDISRKILKQWIPEDYKIYMDIINGKLTAENCDAWFKEQSE